MMFQMLLQIILHSGIFLSPRLCVVQQCNMDDPVHAAINLMKTNPASTASTNSGDGTSTAGSSRHGRKESQKTCLIVVCEEQKKPGSKFCRFHTCHRDNLLFAASKMGEEQKEAQAAAMKIDSKAADMVLEWSEKNIASPLFKNGMVDWAEWNSRYGLQVGVREGSMKIPFEKRQFVIRQVTKFGRTEKEAESLWNQAEAENHKRDYKGFNGQLRLWLAKQEYQDSYKDKHVNEEAIEGSNRKKKIKESDRDAMRLHVDELQLGHHHEFFHGRSSLASSSKGGLLSTSSAPEPEATDDLEAGMHVHTVLLLLDCCVTTDYVNEMLVFAVLSPPTVQRRVGRL